MKRPWCLGICLTNTFSVAMHVALLFSFLCWLSVVQAQHRNCTLEEQLDFAQEVDIESYRRYLATAQSAQSKPANLRSDIVLPIVVHIVYTDAASNISDFQIYSQIETLNQAFAEGLVLGADVLPEHRALATVPGISFRLACVDPDSNPTSGITRTQTTIDNIGSVRQPGGKYVVHHDDLGGKDPWPTDRYINIWVCDLDDSLLGRATLPIAQQDPNSDGVVISYRNFGYTGIATQRRPYHLGHTLIHEMGHYFGLQHPWGERAINPTCEQGDGIDDTPAQSEIYYDCPLEGSVSSCGSVDMTKNFMGYVDDACSQYFTAGQVNRMRVILNGFRSGLLASTAADNCGTPHTTSFKLWHRVDEREWIISVPSDDAFIDFTAYNMKGQVIQHGTVRNETILHLPPSIFPAGLYVIQFRWDDGMEQLVVPLY